MGDTEEFSIFWKRFPRKVAKGHARKAFAKVIQHVPLQTLLDAIDAQTFNRANMEKHKMFVPEWKYPATWLNAECWSDELMPVLKKAAGGRNVF